MSWYVHAIYGRHVMPWTTMTFGTKYGKYERWWKVILLQIPKSSSSWFSLKSIVSMAPLFLIGERVNLWGFMSFGLVRSFTGIREVGVTMSHLNLRLDLKGLIRNSIPVPILEYFWKHNHANMDERTLHWNFICNITFAISPVSVNSMSKNKEIPGISCFFDFFPLEGIKLEKSDESATKSPMVTTMFFMVSDLTRALAKLGPSRQSVPYSIPLRTFILETKIMIDYVQVNKNIYLLLESNKLFFPQIQ